jgi:uncharacterized repeat protein (TIGR03803 family)
MANSFWLTCVVAALAAAPAHAQTATETIVYNFGYFPQGSQPYGTPFRDSAGNLYGTANQGGTLNLGTVFEYTATGKSKLLHSFTGGADGASPYSGVVLDPARNIYGTTYAGGASGKGTVYKITPTGQESVLYSFTGGADGSGPYAGVILDSSGNLYGATYNGGSANLGAVYKLTPAGQESVLHSFAGGMDGANPYAGLAFDSHGNLYGTTYAGGMYTVGTVYKLSPSGSETVLYAFGNGIPGGEPMGGVILDSAGNLYGASTESVYKVTPAGRYTVIAKWRASGKDGGSTSATLAMDAEGNLYGTNNPYNSLPLSAPYGVVFKVDTAGKFSVLYAFPGPPSPEAGGGVGLTPGVVLDSAGNVYGATPYVAFTGGFFEISASGEAATLYNLPPAPSGTTPEATPVADSAGNLYGAAGGGGAADRGAVYMVNPKGKEKVLYSFTGGADGGGPTSVTRDSAGNLYGTTLDGGADNMGVVFKVDTSGNETVLHSFTGGADGWFPIGGVAVGPHGNLYGTTSAGGTGSLTGVQEGVIFEVNPATLEFTVLHSFTGLSDGGEPEAGVIFDPQGNAYGTTYGGGLGAGVIFEVSASGTYSVLYTFTGADDGANPYSGLALDSSGNLYGTTANFGAGGGGVLYKLDTAGSLAVLYSFAGGPGGYLPFASPVLDSAGNLYGTTTFGGDLGCDAPTGCGVVYELDATGAYAVLYTFIGGVNGGSTEAGLILGPAGQLYGTSAQYGATSGGLLYEIALQ